MSNNPFSSLPGNLGDRAAALVASREQTGCNVHFVNDRGQRDRFSFATIDRAQAFTDKLKADGLTVFASEADALAWEAGQ